MLKGKLRKEASIFAGTINSDILPASEPQFSFFSPTTCHYFPFCCISLGFGSDKSSFRNTLLLGATVPLFREFSLRVSGPESSVAETRLETFQAIVREGVNVGIGRNRLNYRRDIGETLQYLCVRDFDVE